MGTVAVMRKRDTVPLPQYRGDGAGQQPWRCQETGRDQVTEPLRDTQRDKEELNAELGSPNSRSSGVSGSL